jgi:hypothetical protein
MGGEIAVLTQIDVAFPKTKLAQSTKYGQWFRFSNQKMRNHHPLNKSRRVKFKTSD